MTCEQYKYAGPKWKQFKKIADGKLSVEEIWGMVKNVVSSEDRLFYMRDGETPQQGYRELINDDNVAEMVHASRHTGVCKIHVYHEGSVAKFPHIVADDESWYRGNEWLDNVLT